VGKAADQFFKLVETTKQKHVRAQTAYADTDSVFQKAKKALR
jgi:hypothetical protein